MIKVLFLIHDLGHGGAEKVLINLVNHMDKTKFDITVISLFGGGVNEEFLSSGVRYKAIYKKMIPANSRWMKLWIPEKLHRKYIKEHYDIEVSYLEGPSARVISGCNDKSTRLVSWIHSVLKSEEDFSRSFRSFREAQDCYARFDRIICVSDTVKNHFMKHISDYADFSVLYNTVDSERITEMSEEAADIKHNNYVQLVSVGTLKEVKGYKRLLRICKRLKENNYKFKLILIGDGPDKSDLESYIRSNELNAYVQMIGYQSNPYKYVSKCDLFVCSSYSEGFSTACTEALIVGTPVCTTEVSGMREMLGDSEYGLITENSEEGLYQGIKRLLDDRDLLSYYKIKAAERGLMFNTENTVRAVEEMLEQIV